MESANPSRKCILPSSGGPLELDILHYNNDLSRGLVSAWASRRSANCWPDSPQKPLQRAYQRDPEAIELWQSVSYPAIARQARMESGEVFFWDESGFRADAVHGRTWASKENPGGASGATAIDQCGIGGECQGRVLVLHLRRWADGRAVRPPVADDDAASLEAGTSGGRWAAGPQDEAVKDYVQSTKGRLTLHFLPGMRRT
jgi:hypothetical protein